MIVTIDFNGPILDLKGVQLPNSPSLCNFYAEELAKWPAGDAKKFYAWALTLEQCKPLVLSQADAQIFREWINASTSVIILVKGQALKIIDRAIEESERAQQ